ncbi:protein lifeguard 1-like isoform 4-T5 [Lycaon pictus]|uniref:protein lifeguard 1-like isoform X3 n=1 Tax=Canis lupus dingo TaxID=286419 RepID=UPI000DC6C6AE|nr:protein lifeguard 1-like isoform X3 [Canis lupus dingo]
MEMDLEVREPIDFSSGDHQHLVRKAADSNIHTKAGQPYATSPSEAPKTHGNPRPKTREQMDIYVVQISDETTPDDSNNLANPFSDSWIRRAFIIKVFLILSAQLVVTGAIVSVFLFWKGLKAWVLVNAWFTYAILPAFFVVLIVLACCGKLRRQVPANYILLGLFTVLQGLLLGAVSVFYNAEEVLWATAATALVTLSLTLFALQTKWDFTMLNGMLFVLLFVLIIYGILLLFIRSYWLHLLYAGLGTIVFSLEITAQKERVLHKVQGARTHPIHCLHTKHAFSPYCSFARRLNGIQRLSLLKNYNLV